MYTEFLLNNVIHCLNFKKLSSQFFSIVFSKPLCLFLFCACIVVIVTNSYSASNSYSPEPESNSPSSSIVNNHLDQAKNSIREEQYETAINYLLAANKADQRNADVYNLLGYSHRKLQRYDDAWKYYQKALTINPEHTGANEYLGELYIETGKISKAQTQLSILHRLCEQGKGCEEYQTLKTALQATANGTSLESSSSNW